MAGVLRLEKCVYVSRIAGLQLCTRPKQTLGSSEFGEPEVEVEVAVAEDELDLSDFVMEDAGNLRGSWNTCFSPFYPPQFSGHSTKD
jgi:hypothetical protein